MINAVPSHTRLSRCVFCVHRHEGDRSLEHVFQDAIGGTLTVLLPCRDCNSRLGHRIDHLLTDHLFVQMRRHFLGFADPDEPDPLLSRDGTLPDGSRVRTHATSQDGMSIRSFPVIERGTDDEGRATFQGRFDANDLDAARTALRRFARNNGTPLNDQQIEHLIEAATRTQQQATVNYSVRVPHLDPRPLVKIAYEVACLLLGEPYFRGEADARRIRRYLYEPERNTAIEEELRIQIRLEAPQTPVGVFPRGMTPFPMFADDTHYVLITGVPEGLFARIYIYGHIAANVRLSETVPMGVGGGFVVSNRHDEPALVQTLEQYISPFVHRMIAYANGASPEP